MVMEPAEMGAPRDRIVLQPWAGGRIFVPDVGRRGELGGDLLEQAWATQAAFAERRAEWRQRQQIRDLAVLLALHQHAYLDTEHIRLLFWPGASPWAARRRLRWLRELGLVMRWRHLLPASAGGWVWLPHVWMLTQAGAAIVAGYLGRKGREAQRAIQRSRYLVVQTQAAKVAHDLQVNDFFVDLAAALAPLDDHGLHGWLGEHSVRRQVERERELGVAEATVPADGLGRVLTPDGALEFHVEVDRGTEQPVELAAKARDYLQHARPGDQVLFVLPSELRERSARGQLERADIGSERAADRRVGCWTTTSQLLAASGPLGAVWKGFGEASDGRRELLELERKPAPPQLDVRRSLGKPRWWMHRPAIGEGI